MSGCAKSRPTTDDDDVIIVGENAKSTKHQTSKEQRTKQSTFTQNQQAKKRTGPGHEENICRGHETRGTVKCAEDEQGLPAQDVTDSPSDCSAADEKNPAKRRARWFIRCKNRNAWKRAKKRTKQITRGKKTVLNLSNRRLSDDDFILSGKGLFFCPKIKSHDKIKLAEELFKIYKAHAS